ncbi:hypothetical protein BUALT_Bualt19G0019500 [Buddleja alternifolia]|uniref:DDE Tnp4 domain-containing protein n=1 Tax=Buddleja alternifolia TaxID=168488 RepID=A0AAV6W4G9_9LAMI|nr:hypothetical protein BUALT_Bualt19G0019500 [Buddleja alternifolia]
MSSVAGDSPEENPIRSPTVENVPKSPWLIEGNIPWTDYALQQAQIAQKTIETSIDNAIEVTKSRVDRILTTSSAHFNQTIEVPDAAKYRERGPMLLNEQEMLFSDVVATGGSAWTPSSGILPPHLMDESDEDSHLHANDVNDHENDPVAETDMNTNTQAESASATATTGNRRRNVKFIARRFMHTKTKKMSSADKIAHCLQRLVDTVEHDSARSSNDTSRQYTIQQCMDILEEISGIQQGDKLWIMTSSDSSEIVLDSLSKSSSNGYSDDSISDEDSEGAIDGTHIKARLPIHEQVPYIGRKGIPTQNIMAACDFNLCFTFVLPGWEGSAHDTRIFNETIRDASKGFPMPPSGKYYLVDAGYPNILGFLAPYKGQKYHLKDFNRASSYRNAYEVFNHSHSALRSHIERAFGVWKTKFYMVNDIPVNIPWPDQIALVAATMAIHNFVRLMDDEDDHFLEAQNESVDDGANGDNDQTDECEVQQYDAVMNGIRDDICTSITFGRIGIPTHQLY